MTSGLARLEIPIATPSSPNKAASFRCNPKSPVSARSAYAEPGADCPPARQSGSGLGQRRRAAERELRATRKVPMADRVAKSPKEFGSEEAIMLSKALATVFLALLSSRSAGPSARARLSNDFSEILCLTSPRTSKMDTLRIPDAFSTLPDSIGSLCLAFSQFRPACDFVRSPGHDQSRCPSRR